MARKNNKIKSKQKKRRELITEKQQQERKVADELLKSKKIKKSFFNTLRYADKNPEHYVLDYEDKHPVASALAEEFKKGNIGFLEKRSIIRLVELCKRTKMMDSDYAITFVKAFIPIVKWQYLWVRKPEEWNPKSKNPNKQFSSLLRHLFCKYNIPIFLDEAWTNDFDIHKNRLYQEWFINLGNGENIRKQKKLPIELTKKMAHWFLQTPSNYSISQGFRRAQIFSLGGDERVSKAVMGTPLGTNNFSHDDFWIGVIRFFVENPMLDPNHYGPIYDYIFNQRYTERQIRGEDNLPIVLPPLEPNLTMKGRTVDTLLRQVEKWHDALAQEQRRTRTWGYRYDINAIWKSCGINGFEKETGKQENRTKFIIFELLSSKELCQEGNLMGHCVSSYSTSCQKGSAAIYTLHKETPNDLRKLLTIQICPQTKEIIQARKRGNAKASVEDMNILKQWSNKVGLKISTWIMI